RSRVHAGHTDRYRDVPPVARPGALAADPRRSPAADQPASRAMNTHSITEADLHAYVDGRLPESRLAEIEAYLAAHPAEAERLQAYREQKAALRALFDPLLDEPLPAALRELAEPPPAGAGTPHRSFL